MGKLFIFGIGGTGSRVLKSLTMLLSAGVKIDADEIVPVIIDPDHAAANLTETVTLMRDYNKIHNALIFNTDVRNQFFRTKINLEILPNLTMKLGNTESDSFRNYIGYDSLDSANKALASMLFSERNLNLNMAVGFKGNPNIGSVVLNQFTNNDDYKAVVSNFKDGDRIFVISSIFGGTGASGFPLLVKNLRNPDSGLASCQTLKTAPIGAVTVLPYFDLEQPEDNQGDVDAATFVSKTKAALTYYKDNLNEPNALYYVADSLSKQQKYCEGGTKQKNEAHIVELISALAIINFASIPADQLTVNENGLPTQQIYKEYGIKNESQEVIFENVSDQTNYLIKTPLTQYLLFCKFLKERLKDSYIGTKPWMQDLGYDKNYFVGNFMALLQKYKDASLNWMHELARNRRSFSPYALEEKPSELFSLVHGVKPRKVASLDSNYDLFDNRLSKLAKEYRTGNTVSKDHVFVDLFYNATKQLVNEKLGME